MERRLRLRRTEDFARLRQEGTTAQNRYVLIDPQLRTGFDVVLVVRQPLVQQSFDAVSRIVTEMFRQANLMLVESSEG